MSADGKAADALHYARSKPRRLSLRRNFSWTFAGQTVHAASLWLIVVVFAKLGSAELLGTWSLSLAIATPVMVGAMLHLRQVQATDVRSEYQFAHYFGLRLVMSVLAMLVIVGVAVLGPYEGTERNVILLVGLAKAVDTVSEIIRGLFQRYEQMDISGLGLVIRGPIAVAAVWGVFVLSGDLAQAAAALVVVWIAAVALYDLPQAARVLRAEAGGRGGYLALWPSLAPDMLLRLFWRALPLGGGMFLLTLASAIPRYFLSGQGLAKLGFYSAAAYVVMASQMLIAAVGQAAAPRLAHYFADDLRAFRRLFRRMMGIAVVIGGVFVAGAILVGRPVLTLLYTAEYAAYHVEFVIMSVSVALTCMTFFGGVGLAATRRFGFQLLAGIATVSVTTVASWSLVPAWGVRGAAIASLLGHIATVVVYFWGLAVLVRQRAADGSSGELDSQRIAAPGNPESGRMNQAGAPCAAGLTEPGR